MIKVLITGGCGFIGHHFVEHFLKNTNWHIYIIDNLTYASTGFDRVRDINVFDDKRCTFFTSDITKPIANGLFDEIRDTNYILHLAAETHVDNSIINPLPFVYTNVLGTMNILNFARKLKNLQGFLYFSTDEVFGPAGENASFKEWDRYKSGNPYAATKAGGEELCLAYCNTYKLPIFITHTMNNFGERQHPEKFIPMIIRSVLGGTKVCIHSYPDLKRAGSRYYIHCRNVAQAVALLLEKFEVGEKYNIVGEKEVDNLYLAQFIADVVGGKLIYEMVDFHSSRPGHDVRYALDDSKMKLVGWQPPMKFEESLEKTVKWTLENPRWLSC